MNTPDFSKEVRPTLNKVFVKLIKESSNYFGEIKKLDSKVETEPYVLVVSISDKVMSVNPGDLAYVRYGLQFQAFKFGEEYYAFISEHDIEAVITPVVTEYMKNEKSTQKLKESLS